MCVTIFGCKITAPNSHKVKDRAKLRKKNDICKGNLIFGIILAILDEQKKQPEGLLSPYLTSWAADGMFMVTICDLKIYSIIS
jgi:hypothetical protein